MPAPTIADRVRQAIGIDLTELSGTALAGEIPLTEALVNRLIAERLSQSPGAVDAARVEAHDNQELTIVVSMRGSRMMPQVKIAARIEQQPQFPSPAVLGLRWSLPGLGPLALFAAPALAYFKALPPFIRVEGDRMSVDLRALLHAQGLGDVIQYVRLLHVQTRRGVIVVQFELRVPQGSGDRRSDSASV